MISTIGSFLKKWPLHLLLLPVFFIINIDVQLGGLLHTGELLPAFFKVTGCLLLFFAILYLFYKDRNKAGVSTTIAGILFLYFGLIKDTMDKWPLLDFIASYEVLLPLLLAAGIFFFYKLRKIRSLRSATLFLNILFLIYVGIEVYKWIGMTRYDKANTGNELSQQSPYPASQKLQGIYYILLDTYPSSVYQREVLGIDQNPFDSLLAAKGFFVIPDAKSNYNLTSFSLASVFGMQYLDWMNDVRVAKPYHYGRSANAIMQAPLFGWLQKNNYRLYNLSIFDLPGQPSMNKERFFSEITSEIIFFNTFWAKAKWHILPYLFPSMVKDLAIEQRQNMRTLLGHFKQYNISMLDSLRHLSSARDTLSRKFVYAHLEMPHYPYFYDSAGHPYPDEIAFSSAAVTDKNMFRNYIVYTNRTINTLLDSLLNNNQGNDIIIVQSDHGTKNMDTTRMADAFLNYSAFYFPDRDYRLLYPGMSNVNTFRIIFNKYFGQQLPLLKDSSIYIK
jgi:hypothetical protein